MALTDKLNAIADAIREKTGKEEQMTLAQMPGEISRIETTGGGITLPELDNPASAVDVASGKEFICEDGTVMTGELQTASSMFGIYLVPSQSEGSTSISLRSTFNGRKILENGAVIELSAETSEFGNATASQVAKGATFTSAAGLLVEGTMEGDTDGVSLPELVNPASATDVVLDKEFISDDGTVITGSLYESGVGVDVFGTGDIGISGTPGGTSFVPYGIYQPNKIGDNTVGFVCRPGTRLGVRSVQTSLLGNAAADQVMKGATFTSEAGYLVEGTHECVAPVLKELTITENGEYTPSEGVDGFSKIVANIATNDGGSDGGAELVYETTFTIAESQTGTSEVTIATIDTGFNQTNTQAGDEFYVVIRCINDTDADTSYNHFRARTQNCVFDHGAYTSVNATSGIVRSEGYWKYGSSHSIYVKSGTRYFAQMTVCAKGHATWGFAPSGDYSFRVYRLSKDYFGMGGLYD